MAKNNSEEKISKCSLQQCLCNEPLHMLPLGKPQLFYIFFFSNFLHIVYIDDGANIQKFSSTGYSKE